jgi:hypothetical protein
MIYQPSVGGSALVGCPVPGKPRFFAPRFDSIPTLEHRQQLLVSWLSSSSSHIHNLVVLLFHFFFSTLIVALVTLIFRGTKTLGWMILQPYGALTFLLRIGNLSCALVVINKIVAFIRLCNLPGKLVVINHNLVLPP